MFSTTISSHSTSITCIVYFLSTLILSIISLFTSAKTTLYPAFESNAPMNPLPIFPAPIELLSFYISPSSIISIISSEDFAFLSLSTFSSY